MESILQLPAHEIQARLTAGSITSVDLVLASLGRIEKYNTKFNVLISIAPREKLLERASKLDAERKAGNVRGKLHGIPIVLKDAIVTSDELGMKSTGGAAVFATLKAKKNAPVVDRLLDAGLIIVGKGSMTEFCGMKSNNTPIGWCAMAGQTLSPWRRKDLKEEDQPIPAGSSSGSGVAISAGFVPLAVGTETSGSLVYPASVNGLYGMKLAKGKAPIDGMFCISESFDMAGPMARDPEDVAALADVMEGTNGQFTDKTATQDPDKRLDSWAVGVLEPTWGIHECSPENKWAQADVVGLYDAAINKMRNHAGRVVYPLELADIGILKHEEETLQTIAYAEFSDRIKAVISFFEENSEVESLEDIVKWNEEHKDVAMPEPYNTQTELIAATKKTMSPELRETALKELARLAGPDGLGAAMKREGSLDIVLGSSECFLVAYAACAGWPIASVPIGNWKKNGQPLGMFAIAKDGREDVLIDFMRVWHKIFDAVEGPNMDE